MGVSAVQKRTCQVPSSGHLMQIARNPEADWMCYLQIVMEISLQLCSDMSYIVLFIFFIRHLVLFRVVICSWKAGSSVYVSEIGTHLYKQEFSSEVFGSVFLVFVVLQNGALLNSVWINLSYTIKHAHFFCAECI